jgi:hypothetical protein
MDKRLTTFFMSIILFSFLFISVSLAALYVKPAKQGVVRVEIFSFIPATVTKNFDVGNFYNFSIDVTLQSTGNITELINIPESSFTLQPNETKNIEYTLTISKPGIYTGGILINVKSTSTATITYQSDLAVIANKSKTQPELYVIITVVVILFLIIVYLKNKRHKK